MSAAAAAGLSETIKEESTGAPLGEDPKNPQRDDKVKRMGTASIPRLIIEFAIPSVVGMLVNGAYSIIDSIFLGQALGDIGPETMTVANPIMIIFMALSLLVGVGGNALAALRLGEKRRVDAEVSLGNTFFLCLVVSLLIAICGLTPFLLDAVLTFSSATEAIRPYAESFIRIICCGFIFQCVGMAINNFIRTAGAPNRALLTMVIGAVACTFFNYLFVLVFNWGVEGSAYATICGQAIACGCVLWYFIFTKGVPLRLHLRYVKPRIKVIGQILSLGLASFFVQAGAAIVSVLTNYLLVLYGSVHPLGADMALTSIGVVQRLAMFSIMPIIGVAVAVQPLVGFNYGAKNYERVRKIFWCAVAGATMVAVFTWAIIHIFPEQIVRIFGLSEGELIDFTVFALKVQVALIPLIGFQIVGSNYFQATGQPMKSVILTLTRQIIFLIPLLIFLPQLLPYVVPSLTSLDALYFAAPIADLLAIFTTGIFIAFEMKRLNRLKAGEIKPKLLNEEL